MRYLGSIFGTTTILFFALIGDSFATIQWQEHMLNSNFPTAERGYGFDLDQDGDNDIIVAAGVTTNSISWFENTSENGNFSFSHHNIITNLDGACAADVADLDGDGDLDVIGTGSEASGTFKWAENDGSESFTIHSVNHTTFGCSDICARDMDGDGDIDIVGSSLTDNAIYWFENDGAANFTPHTVTSGYSYSQSACALDMDGDGDMDILGSAANLNTISWFENDGSQNFTEHEVSGSFSGASEAMGIDVDGDGDMDVVGSASEASAFAWFENDGSENFTQHTLGTGLFAPDHVHAGDINHDTFIDVVGPSQHHLRWWANDGAETFTPITMDFTAEFVHICDIDGNGYNDLLAGLTAEYGQIAWFQNLSNAPNGFAFSHPDSAHTIHCDTLTLSWEIATDPDEDELSYIVQWSEQTNFHSLSADTVPDNFVALDSLQDDTTYYWRVTALDTNGAVTAGQDGGYWSFSVDIYQPPAPFTLIGPEETDTCWTLDTLFTWQRTFDPDPYDSWVHYDVWLDTLADLSTAVLIADSIPDTVCQVLNLLDYRTYYWTVRATDSNTGGTWASDTLSFRTYLPEHPAPFSLVFPHDSSRVNEDTVTVRWLSSSDPDPTDIITYHVEWSIDPAFSAYNSATTTDTFFAITEIAENLATLQNSMNWDLDELADDQTVYWRVWAVDLFELVTWALPGETGWSFQVYIPQRPITFALVAPEDETVMDQLSWQFEWDNTTDPDPGDVVSFQLEVSMSHEFLDSLTAHYTANADTTFFVPWLADDTDYWWRVHALDTNTSGTYSEQVWSFHTAMPERPLPFDLLTPSDGDTLNHELQLAWQMSWDPDPDEDVTYDAVFTVSLDDGSDTTLVFTSLSDTAYTASLTDSLHLEYWEDYLDVEWFVRAISAGDTVESDNVLAFVIEPNSAVPETEFAGIPTDFSIAATYPNPFNSRMTVVMALPEQTELTLEVFNILGERVALLSHGQVKAGYHPFSFNATLLSSGTYFVTATMTGEKVQVQKVVLLR